MRDNAVPPMKVGFNYPWSHNLYGQNFGPVFFPPPLEGLPMWKTTLPSQLIEFKAMGISVIRWFILMNGLNYGYISVDGSGRVQTIELPVNNSIGFADSDQNWGFRPPEVLDPLFTDHFRLMLKMFRDSGTGLQVIPSLVDFSFFAVPPNNVASAGGGRQEVALDKEKRKRFFDTVLEPMLQVSIPFKDQIFAWEVMNEPSWLIKKHLSVVTNDMRMNLDVLQTFLQEALARIEAHPEFALKSTVGHRYITDLDTLPTGKLRQFHYYAKTWADDPENIPDYATSKAFVGEFAADCNSLVLAGMRSHQGAPWPELKRRDLPAAHTVTRRLQLLSDKGYSLAMVWPPVGDGSGDATNRIKLDAVAQGSIERYTGTWYIR